MLRVLTRRLCRGRGRGVAVRVRAIVSVFPTCACRYRTIFKIYRANKLDKRICMDQCCVCVYLRYIYLAPSLLRLFRAREALRQCLPDALKDQTFAAAIHTEDSVQRWLALLIKNLNDPSTPGITSPTLGTSATATVGGSGVVALAGAGGLKSAAVNLPTIPSGASGAFGYSSVPLASANWNS